MLVNILSSGLASPNSIAFLHPIIRHKNSIESNSIDLNIYYELNEKLYECDLLIIDSKFFTKYWSKREAEALALLEKFNKHISKVFFFDIMDSSTWDQIKVLPYVDKYYKCQLLKDRTLYSKSYYGYRIFTNYYHEKFCVVDENEGYSEPIIDPKLLDKLRVSWNTSLSDYSCIGFYKLSLYRYLRLKNLLNINDGHLVTPLHSRDNKVSCRIGNLHGRKSVAWQRLRVRELLKSYISTNKLRRRKYFHEMMNSKVSISPFGFGEITLRDFEIILCGSILIKPDMSHVDTWPDLYKDNVTYKSYKWDMSDLLQTIEDVTLNYNKYIDIAENAQNEYRKYIIGTEAEEQFVSRFISMVTED